MADQEPVLPPILEPEAPPAAAPPAEEPERLDKFRIGKKEFASNIGPLFGGLFVLYLIISGNYVGELFSCDLQQILTENYAIKHLLGIFTLFFFVTLAAPDIKWNKLIVAGVTLGMYLLFIISNRSSATTQLINIGLLFAIFVLQMTRTQAKRKEDELGEDHTVLKERLVTSQWAVAIAILALAVYGHILYIGKKRIEFRGKFSYFKLFKGTVCRNVDEREYGWAESLKAFFGVFENPAPAKVRTQTPLLTGDFFDNGSDISE